MYDTRRQTLIWRAFMGSMIVLCLLLGALQYRWIGEASRAERERLRAGLRSSLIRLNFDLNSEIAGAMAAVVVARPLAERSAREAGYAARYAESREASRRPALFESVSLAAMEDGRVVLKQLNLKTNAFERIDWPPEWERLRSRFERDGGGFPFGRRGGPQQLEGGADTFEIPVFQPPGEGEPGQPLEWLIFKLNLPYVRSELLPELLERHLGTAHYRAEILEGDTVLYRTDRDGLGGRPDASIRLLDPRAEMGGRRGRGFRGGGPGPGPGPGFGMGPPGEHGRWLLNVRHAAGSLDTVVERNRWLNIAMVSAVLVLLIAAVAALARFTRRSQRLAELQMQFVAGVSHELRTPLTVMRTAGHNLKQTRVATDPTRVERYGALIEEESHKLASLVEQVLRFANVSAGRVLASREPLSVASVIEEALTAEHAAIGASGCALEKDIAPDLPEVSGDRNSLRHALQNLISNAAKYGRGGATISVRALLQDGGVEIRVADRGPGIPKGELNQIFEPFFRGNRAVQDQIHGTGLGLNLAKRIIEAHDGNIYVESEEGKGTEFTVRLPAAARAAQHEFSNTAD